VALSVLGPLHLEGPAGSITIQGRKTREVLALLALAAPRPLSALALTDRLWDEPPPAAVKSVQAHVSRVRSALATAQGEAGVVHGGPVGYQLVAGVEQLDVLTIDELRRRARIAVLAGDDHGAAQLLRQARQRWRGEPELPATAAGEAERARLAQEHMLLVEDQLDATIAAGRASDVLGELESLTALHPLRERLWCLRMTALYHCGRQADALRAYRSARSRLLDEVGVEPGPELRALEVAVLQQTVSPAGPAIRATTTTAIASDVPRYADAGGVHVAYGTYGAGTGAGITDVLLLNPTFIPVDAYLEEPHLAQAVTRLATGRRVIAFDRRGLGLSDPVSPAEPPTVGQWVQDAVAVLVASRAASVHVLANGDTGLIALLLAATHPDPVASLTLVNSYARLTTAENYLYGDPPSVDEVLREIRTPDSRPVVDVLSWIAPSVATDARFRSWWDAVGRRGASPRTAELVHGELLQADVRDVLTQVRVPVLVLSRLGCASYDPGHGRYLAAHLPDARLAEHPDPDGPWFLGDVAWVLDQFEAFTSTRAPPRRR
jgi:DNA-binding SARP family transcriptional activator